jgi:FkbM family methyltransferase
VTKIEASVVSLMAWSKHGKQEAFPATARGLLDIVRTGLLDLGINCPDLTETVDKRWVSEFLRCIVNGIAVPARYASSYRTYNMQGILREHGTYHVNVLKKVCSSDFDITLACDEPEQAIIRNSFCELVADLASGFAKHGRVPHCGQERRTSISGAVLHDSPHPFQPTRPTCRTVDNISAEVQLNFGLPIFVDTQDDSVSPDIIRTGWWELWINGVIRKNIGLADVVVNVGANVGYHTLLSVRCVESTGKVFAFEPNPRGYQLPGRTIIWAGLMATTLLFPFAVGEKRGTAKFSVSPTILGGGSFFFWSPDQMWLHVPQYRQLDAPDLMALKRSIHLPLQTIEVHVATLDATVGKAVDQIHLLIMYAQQAEPQILEGATDLTSRSQDLTIIMEWGYGPKLAPNKKMRMRAKKIIEILANDGFKFWKIIGDAKDTYANPAQLERMIVEDVMATDQFVDLYASRQVGE